MNQTEPLSQQPSSPAKRATVFQVIKALLWGALGVRKLEGYENDISSITPKQAIIGALIGGGLFVGTVLLIVNLAIRYLK